MSGDPSTRSPLPALIPELLVNNLDVSLAFWCDLIGFEVLYDRPEDRFAMLTLGIAAVMLEERQAGVRQWVTGALEPPLGRGINFEIKVPSVAPIRDRLISAGLSLIMDLDESWYRAGDQEYGQCQFVVADPDGYLLRLAEDLEHRLATPTR